ncbi:MAG: MATE family efflux transporter, partial [Lachnospiraceae bacterium]|nr:MATE family efflux transporter [Lachnospiraceae bacterium]
MLFGKKSGSYTIDMCSGPIVSRLLLFAGPLMLSSILQLLFNAADVIVVGKYAGDNSLAAVGMTGPLINLLVSAFLGLSIGSNVLASRYYGSGDDAAMSRTVHTSILVSFISGIVLAVVGIIFSTQILEWMRAPGETLQLGSLYLRIYFLGMPASMLYNFGSALLRAVGDTKRPMYYLLAAGVVNVILNLFFVISLHMDVAGVATATVISQVISAYLVVRCLMKESGPLQLRLKSLAIDKATFIRIVRIGVPASFQGMLFSISNVIIQSSVNGFGETVVAGNSASQNIEGFVYMSMNAFYQACISFISANV